MAYEMVMPYHLHMPSYFLETFTEYPLLAMIDQKGYPTAKWKAKSRLNLGWIIG